jgi:four helix bundle protein
MLLMKTSDWTFKNKPYNLRQRLFGFACAVTRLVQFLHTRGPVAIELSTQLLACGNSAAANYEEADDGTSPKDRIAKTLIVLRELKETRLRLRVLRAAGLLNEEHDPVIAENTELVKIVATIIRNSKRSAHVR